MPIGAGVPFWTISVTVGPPVVIAPSSLFARRRWSGIGWWTSGKSCLRWRGYGGWSGWGSLATFTFSSFPGTLGGIALPALSFTCAALCSCSLLFSSFHLLFTIVFQAQRIVLSDYFVDVPTFLVWTSLYCLERYANVTLDMLVWTLISCLAVLVQEHLLTYLPTLDLVWIKCFVLGCDSQDGGGTSVTFG